MRTETVKISELNVGDVVVTHGMRVKLTQENRTYSEGVRNFSGEILNRDYVTGEARALFAGIVPTRGPDAFTWTVQSNDLANWAREIEG